MAAQKNVTNDKNNKNDQWDQHVKETEIKMKLSIISGHIIKRGKVDFIVPLGELMGEK